MHSCVGACITVFPKLPCARYYSNKDVSTGVDSLAAPFSPSHKSHLGSNFSNCLKFFIIRVTNAESPNFQGCFPEKLSADCFGYRTD